MCWIYSNAALKIYKIGVLECTMWSENMKVKGGSSSEQGDLRPKNDSNHSGDSFNLFLTFTKFYRNSLKNLEKELKHW